jgi:hypothetical protein
MGLQYTVSAIVANRWPNVPIVASQAASANVRGRFVSPEKGKVPAVPKPVLTTAGNPAKRVSQGQLQLGPKMVEIG